MLSQELRLCRYDLRELAFERGGDMRVKLLASAAEQGAVSGILHQRMLEQVARQRWHALPEQQACLNETVERRAQLRLGLARYRRQQGVREIPPDGRSD